MPLWENHRRRETVPYRKPKKLRHHERGVSSSHVRSLFAPMCTASARFRSESALSRFHSRLFLKVLSAEEVSSKRPSKRPSSRYRVSTRSSVVLSVGSKVPRGCPPGCSRSGPLGNRWCIALCGMRQRPALSLSPSGSLASSIGRMRWTCFCEVF